MVWVLEDEKFVFMEFAKSNIWDGIMKITWAGPLTDEWRMVSGWFSLT